MSNTNKLYKDVNGVKIETFIEEITSANILEIEVGTNGLQGGDTGHGSRTYFRLKDLSSTDMSANVVTDKYGSTEVIIELGGDSELETFIQSLEFAVSKLKEKLTVKHEEASKDCGKFIEKIISEYKFAKGKNFDSIAIVIETSGGEYEISEYEDGFINDNLDGVYSELDEIAGDLFSLISMNNNKVEGFRIE